MTERNPYDPWDVPEYEASRTTKAADTQPRPAVCKCGAIDHGRTESDVIDMTGVRGQFTLTRATVSRTCRACEHGIWPDNECVAHRPTPGHAVFNTYHPECVDFGGRND